MVFQFIKKTGQVIASYPENYSKPPDIKVSENGVEVVGKNDTDYAFLMPLEALRYIDPRKEQYNIHKRKIIFDKSGKPLYLTDPQTNKKVTITLKTELKKNIDAWNELYEYLKTQYPKLKIQEALEREGMS